MAIVFLHTVSLILIALKFDEAEANKFDENLCFETIFKFMSDQKKCDFSQEDALRLLKDNSITCQIKCSVSIQNIYSDNNWLEIVDITFGGTVYVTYPCPWDEDNNSKSIQASINCTAWNKGHLALNQSCSFSEQCAGSPYASCLGGNCSCVDGYTAENATSCVQSQKSILPEFQHQEEANIGTTLGALFGGLVLGVILTTATVMIIYRRSKKHVNKRQEFKVTFADNETYSSAKVVDPNAIQTKNEKREVSPYSDSAETSVYNNVYGKPKNGQTQDDVYNHLHEQGKRDDIDYYDHACAASASIGDMGDYSHLRHTTS